MEGLNPMKFMGGIYDLLGDEHQVTSPILKDITTKIQTTQQITPHEAIYVSSPWAYVMSNPPDKHIEYAIRLGVDIRVFPPSKYLTPFFDLTYDYFELACQYGRLEMAQFILHETTFHPNDLTKNNVIFRLVCENGHLHVIMWLVKVFPHFILQDDDDAFRVERSPTIHPSRSYIDYVFHSACIRNHLHVVQWLVGRFPGIDYRSDNTFSDVCYHGHLRMAMWLSERFPDIHDTIMLDRVFIWTCSNGHLQVARWLIKVFPQIDPHFDNDYAFYVACWHGHLYVAKWLVERFPDINYRVHDDEAFRAACRCGHLHMAKWLIKRFPRINCRSKNDNAFHDACFNGYLSVAKWLLQMFPDINIKVCCDIVFVDVCMHNYISIIKWLIEQEYDYIEDRLRNDEYFRFLCSGNDKQMINMFTKIFPHINFT